MSQPGFSPLLSPHPCRAIPGLCLTPALVLLYPFCLGAVGPAPTLMRSLPCWQCHHICLLAHRPCSSLTNTLTSIQNFNSSHFLLEAILLNIPWTICFYFRLGMVWNNLLTHKIMLDVLLLLLIHSLLWLLQMSVSKVPLDSVEQEETCGTVEDELGVYEGGMKSNNNVLAPENLYSKCNIHYLHFSKAFIILFFFL